MPSEIKNMNDNSASTSASATINWMWVAYAAVVLFSLIFLFREGLGVMVDWWENKLEYNHGYLIPVVAIYLVLLRGEGRQASVLVGRRASTARFMPGIYAFPGGGIERSDFGPCGFDELPQLMAGGLDLIPTCAD